MKNLSGKKLIVFDLDGTLAESKSVMDGEMDDLLTKLLRAKKVAVIGGGKYGQFKSQLLFALTAPKELLKNLFLFPTTSTAFYRYNRGWKNVYELDLSRAEKESVREAFRDAFVEAHFVPPKKTYGPLLEDRGTQMSFSPLGQEVVTALGAKGIRLKEQWKAKNDSLRFKIAQLVQKRVPQLEVRVGGLTTIDVTRQGIDKGYGVLQIKKHLKIPIDRMVFIGDALYPGGNDYAAKRTGIQCIAVRGPEDTKKIIKKILN